MDRNSMNFWVMLSYLFIHSEIRCTENSKRWLIPQGKKPRIPSGDPAPKQNGGATEPLLLKCGLEHGARGEGSEMIPSPKKMIGHDTQKPWWILVDFWGIETQLFLFGIF
jgi:hypothetical protein